jgi:uncharacterized protein with HEPN domain
VNYRDQQRLLDISASIATIRSHLNRGPLGDGLIFDGIRIRLIEIGEAVKSLPPELLAREPSIPWREITRTRDHLAHRYFDTSQAIVQATIEHDLPALAAAVERLTEGEIDTDGDSPRGAGIGSDRD